jgi:hypothetical protein
MAHVKDSYYFSHDSNARNDEKILMLRAEHGWEGYGIFWALIETMFENEETCLNHNRIKGIALSYNIDITLLQNVIDTCIKEKLFESDGEKFWSNSLRRRKAKFLELREKRSNAGKKGAEARWYSNDEKEKGKGEMANAWQTHSIAIAKNGKGKESTVKKSTVKKVNKPKENYAEFVSMTEEEYKKLVEQHGEQATKQMIEILDNYKGASGKTYESDYRAILSWVVKRYQEEKSKAKPESPASFWDNDYTFKGQREEEKEAYNPEIDNLIEETLEKMSKPKNRKERFNNGNEQEIL